MKTGVGAGCRSTWPSSSAGWMLTARARLLRRIPATEQTFDRYTSLAPVFGLWVGLWSDNSELSGDQRTKSSMRAA